MILSFITKKPYRKRLLFSAGFSLVEALVAMGIFTVIGIAVMTFFSDIFSFSKSAQGQLQIQQELQVLTRRMSAELRAASQSSVGSYALATTSSSTLSFYVDTDNDGVKERIRYFLQGTELKKGTLKPTGSPLAYTGSETTRSMVKNVQATTTPLFSYYDTNYAGTTTPLTQPVTVSSVRLVKITIVVDDNALIPPPAIIGTTQISLRTIKDNL
ncbi:MAG: hypothetical protein NUW02_01495 [Candidatus Campbellbacteria bacterium]|nr:hypothetical protein [Candidatus Campbellbacteria bacterium]